MQFPFVGPENKLDFSIFIRLSPHCFFGCSNEDCHGANVETWKRRLFKTSKLSSYDIIRISERLNKVLEPRPS